MNKNTIQYNAYKLIKKELKESLEYNQTALNLLDNFAYSNSNCNEELYIIDKQDFKIHSKDLLKELKWALDSIEQSNEMANTLVEAMEGDKQSLCILSNYHIHGE